MRFGAQSQVRCGVSYRRVIDTRTHWCARRGGGGTMAWSNKYYTFETAILKSRDPEKKDTDHVAQARAPPAVSPRAVAVDPSGKGGGAVVERPHPRAVVGPRFAAPHGTFVPNQLDEESERSSHHHHMREAGERYGAVQ